MHSQYLNPSTQIDSFVPKGCTSNIWQCIKRPAFKICSCMDTFMTHSWIYIKQRTGSIQTLWTLQPQALIVQTALTTKCRTRPLHTHTVSSSFIPAVPRLNLTCTLGKPAVTNGLRSRAELYRSLSFPVSVAEPGWVRREVFLCHHVNRSVFCCSGLSQMAHRALRENSQASLSIILQHSTALISFSLIASPFFCP